MIYRYIILLLPILTTTDIVSTHNMCYQHQLSSNVKEETKSLRSEGANKFDISLYSAVQIIILDLRRQQQ